ncbi:MAG: UDP-glucose 4-epimerase GalE [Porticoccaceae bacterium]
MSKAVLVTGGAGYIGSHVCKALAAAGYLPVSYDDLRTGHAELVKWGPLELGDVADGARVAAVVDKYAIGACMHLASSAYVGESMTHPERYWHNNVVGGCLLVDALIASGVRHVVFSSSCAVYGEPDSGVLTEQTAKAPINPYGRTKLAMEWLLADRAAAGALDYVALRYFNAAGCDPDGETGEWHEPETHIIPLLLDVALGRRDAFSVFGTDWPTPDGTCIRDYVHVADIAAAHLQALAALQSGMRSDAINLGSGSGFSVRQVHAVCEQVTGRNIRLIDQPRRAGDAAALVASNGRARTVLGWQQHYSELADMVASAWRWMQAR